MEYLIDYGMFLAKAATIVVAIVIVVGTIAAAGSKQKKAGKKGFLKVTRLNYHLYEMR
ncbi:MAG: protease SohB, partial [Gammaproteobacteria bacterium]|nr:protease SohB [Gammaproteobacteria bacterium]